MHSMATDMHQVFVSAPRASSTGSGFGGGGLAAAEAFRAEDSVAAGAAHSRGNPACRVAKLLTAKFAKKSR